MRVLSCDHTEEEMLRKLKKSLDPRRYNHSLGVAYTACSLFMAYGHTDPEELSAAYTAGILHDCAKNLTDDERERYCVKYAVELTDIEKAYPYLIHAKLGAVLAREKYGVSDEAILSAIRWHTTGKADMSFFEAVIFSADFLEPNRKELPCMGEVRGLIYHDLNAAVYRILEQTLIHLDHKGQVVEEHTKEAYEYYKQFRNIQ